MWSRWLESTNVYTFNCPDRYYGYNLLEVGNWAALYDLWILMACCFFFWHGKCLKSITNIYWIRLKICLIRNIYINNLNVWIKNIFSETNIFISKYLFHTHKQNDFMSLFVSVPNNETYIIVNCCHCYTHYLNYFPFLIAFPFIMRENVIKKN